MWMSIAAFAAEPTPTAEPAEVVVPVACFQVLAPPADRTSRLPLARNVSAWVDLTAGVRDSARLGLVGGAPDEIDWRLDGISVTDPVTGGLRPQRFGPTAPAVRGLPGPALPSRVR